MKITLTTGKTINAAKGESLLGALKSNEIFLIASCGGKGSCGKCKVKIISGEAESAPRGRLTQDEKNAGMALACMTFPKGDLLIEIPETSRLVVGEKIAVSRASDLSKLFKEFNVPVSPLVGHEGLHLPPPTLHDSIGDMERLKRAMNERGIGDVRFSHEFTRRMAKALRDSQWKITLGLTGSGCEAEALFITPESQGGDKTFGAAVDIGTTTVVVYLVDMGTGGLIDLGMTYNSQMRFGDDVITRIVHAAEGEGGRGLEELRTAVVEDINNLLDVVLGKHKINRSDVQSMVISGNTTMSHLFWGLDPAHIREEPYIPTLNAFPVWKAGTGRININPQSPVYTVPCVASYVGGDIVAGVLASKMHRNEETALFMDIGTNGEIALGNSEWLVTAACSAGPCFEGSGIKHGMRATEGAIESVRINPKTLDPEISVIGGGTPTGICGSGMIDAISEMFFAGIINQKGKFARDIKTGRVRTGDDGPEYVLHESDRRSVSLTEVDMENVIRAKAAIYAGVSLLVREMGLSMSDIQKIYIAGGFGNYLNVDRAVMLGMLPDLPKDRFKFLGNTSAAGAYLMLLSGELRKEAEDIAGRMTYMELSVSRGFMDEYMSAMFLPHTDMSQFPTVEGIIKGKTSG